MGNKGLIGKVVFGSLLVGALSGCGGSEDKRIVEVDGRDYSVEESRVGIADCSIHATDSEKRVFIDYNDSIFYIFSCGDGKLDVYMGKEGVINRGKPSELLEKQRVYSGVWDAL